MILSDLQIILLFLIFSYPYPYPYPRYGGDMVEIWWRYGGDMMGKRSFTHLVLFTHMIYPTSKCPSNILINDDPLRSIDHILISHFPLPLPIPLPEIHGDTRRYTEIYWRYTGHMMETHGKQILTLTPIFLFQICFGGEG